MTEPSFQLPAQQAAAPAVAPMPDDLAAPATATATTSLVLEAPAPVGESLRPRPWARCRSAPRTRPSSTRWSRATSTPCRRSTPTARPSPTRSATSASWRRRHPGVGGGLQPAPRQAAGGHAARRPDGYLVGEPVAARPPSTRSQDLDPSKQGDLLSPPQAARPAALRGGRPAARLLRQVPLEPGPASTPSSRPSTTARTSCSRTTPSIEQEKVNLWAVMGRLRQYAYLAQTPRHGPHAPGSPAIQATDPDRAKVLQEDMLFYVRQKNQDLLTQLAVSVQGYLALDVIRRNNLELIKGVQRATTTTVSALRTAVIVAQALADQKLVLDQITALNTTTSNLIESTSELLRQQSAGINEQAASATVDLAKLQAAFDQHLCHDGRDRHLQARPPSTRCRRPSRPSRPRSASRRPTSTASAPTSPPALTRGPPTRDDQASPPGGGGRPHRHPLVGASRCVRHLLEPRSPRSQHPRGARRIRGQGPGADAARHQVGHRRDPRDELLRARSTAPRRSPAVPRPTSPGSAAATTCRCCPARGTASWPRRRSCSARSSSG